MPDDDPFSSTIALQIDDPAWEGFGREATHQAVLTSATKSVEDLIESVRNTADAAPLLTVLLTNDARVQALNKEFRDQDKPTNVLSFPNDASDQFGQANYLGDIAIAFETVKREASEQGKDFADHLCHLVIHGCLHLRGYDHETESDAEEMEALEIELLGALNIPNPYADSELA